MDSFQSNFVPDGLPDLDRAFKDGTARLWEQSQRGDGDVAHVSDLTGLCDRQTWARRSGKVLGKPGHDSMVAMSMGLHLERFLLDRLEAGLPEWTMHRNVMLWVWVEHKTGRLTGKLTDQKLKQNEMAVQGHADAVLIKKPYFLVIDTKTTVWRYKTQDRTMIWVPSDDFRHNYKLQVATYMVPYLQDGIEYGAIFEFNKAHSECRTGWVKHADHREEIIERILAVQRYTNPANPEPEVGPNPWTIRSDGTSWACGYAATGKDGKLIIKQGYCDYHDCANHVIAKVRALKN